MLTDGPMLPPLPAGGPLLVSQEDPLFSIGTFLVTLNFCYCFLIPLFYTLVQILPPPVPVTTASILETVHIGFGPCIVNAALPSLAVTGICDIPDRIIPLTTLNNVSGLVDSVLDCDPCIGPSSPLRGILCTCSFSSYRRMPGKTTYGEAPLVNKL